MPDQNQIQPQPNPSQPQPATQPPLQKYQKVERPFWRMVVNNFFGGIAWSLGVLIGASIVIAIAAYFARNINFIPLFGHFFAEILKSAQGNLQTPTNTPIQ